MKTDRQHCFSLSSGEDIYLFTLLNRNGIKVCITNYGAIISSFQIKNEEGVTNDIVLGFDDIKEYRNPEYLKNYPWFGCAVGRYANRIKNAVFKMEGKEIKLSKNAGCNQLHGGFEGFDKKVWKVRDYGTEPCCFVEFEYISPDGEEGFPGNLNVFIRFELNDENELSYEFRATTDSATPVNLTHHSYFNLSNGKETIHDHELKLYATKFLEQDDGLVANGEIGETKNTVYDFGEFTRISDNAPNNFDFDKSFIAEKGISANPELVAEVRHRNSGVILQVYSTEPIVHFYAGKWIPVVVGKNNVPLGPYSGLCLETHNYCNAVNIPHFPDTILKPGEMYNHKTIYRILG